MTTASSSRVDELRAARHPAFNDRALRLGTFGTNCSGGTTMSSIDGVLDADWDQSLDLARMGDQMGFEALVPIGRWKGYGGETNFNGEQFESYTWAAGMASATQQAGVFVTSHVPTIHPIMAAKQLTTIDHISHGRVGLNIVAGWDEREMNMFGNKQLPHDERYAVAQEWVDVLKLVWTSEEAFTYEGKYFTIAEGYTDPKPVQRPHPLLMNAGGSPAGMHFGARNADVMFIQPGLGAAPVEEIKQKAEAAKALAREEYGREVKTWINAYVVQDDTESEAQQFLDYYVNQRGDWVAADNLVKSMGIGDNQSIPAEVMDAMKFHFIAGWAGRPIIGTKDMVADQLIELANNGLDGVLLSWPRYAQDMARFQAETYPLLEQAGVR